MFEWDIFQSEVREEICGDSIGSPTRMPVLGWKQATVRIGALI